MLVIRQGSFAYQDALRTPGMRPAEAILTELDTREAEEADVALGTSRDLAAVVQTNGIGVAGDGTELFVLLRKLPGDRRCDSRFP